MNNVIALKTDDRVIDRAFRIAIGDLVGNIQPWQGELDEHPTPCILAGLDYDKPWTRDAAMNCWYAASMMMPQVATNTLLAVLKEDEWGLRTGGQYWDSIIWVTAAWNHYLCTSDRDFLVTAFQAARNSIRFFEETEFDAVDGLFRGPACCQDGVAGYPDRFADSPSPGVVDWVENHPEEKVKTGHGLPMKAMSTNGLYYNAYRVMTEMADELQAPVEAEWSAKAQRLKKAINQTFWHPERGTYRYLSAADDEEEGRHDSLGHAFAMLFGVADESQTRSIFAHQHITAHGVPCVWPTYDRYTNAEGTSFGRHAGPIWPDVNAAWAMAAAQFGRRDLAWLELQSLAQKACRDIQFSEVFHPLTGEIYGGLQENPRAYPDVNPLVPITHEPVEFHSTHRQTWCATGYLRMVLSTLFGLQIDRTGVSFVPYVTGEMTRMSLSGLHYRDATLTVVVEKSESDPYIVINDVVQEQAIVAADASGPQHITIGLTEGEANG